MKLSKVLFMAKRLYTDLYDHTDMNLCFDNGPELKEYYIVFEEKDINTRGGNKPFKFDNNGVPQIHSYIDVVEGAGYYYYPITIGQYALAIYHSYLQTNSTEKKEHFLRIADWFVNTAIHDERLGAYWLTDVPKPEFDMHKPWKSAFAQSRGISVCLRAYQITGEERYYDLACLAIIPLSYHTKEGGVFVGGGEDTFYEEYVAALPTRILDGAMFSLWGLNDMKRLARSKGDSKILSLTTTLFDNGVKGLEYWLPKFDMGYWMFYNRCELKEYPQNDPCTIGYLRLIIAQLKIMNAITDNKLISDYIGKCESYISPTNIIKMYKEKFIALKKLNRL